MKQVIFKTFLGTRFCMLPGMSNKLFSMKNIHPTSHNPEGLECNYENALKLLGSLVSYEASMKNSAQKKAAQIPIRNISRIIQHLNKTGITESQLNSLNVIHVAGTKGKGSTCAFTECILRHAGLRTGLYTSPHLITVREGVKINGLNLSKVDFAKYVFLVYGNMVKRKKHPKDMPTLFSFMTCLAFNVFIQEKVDVAILEVGCGGRNCPTNVIEKPVVVGITSLGLDHQKILGETLEEITMAKAGIMKKDVPIFTVHTQPPHILNLLRSNAEEIVKCPFYIAPPLESYNQASSLNLGINAQVSQVNAGLALQLTNTFLYTKFPTHVQSTSVVLGQLGIPFHLSKFHFDGLQNCKWAGRFQKIEVKQGLTYYLDGAHTAESLTLAEEWFIQNTTHDHYRVLVVYVSGDRDEKNYLEPFQNTDEIDLVLFCPLIFKNTGSFKPDADNWANSGGTDDEKIAKCKKLYESWNEAAQKSLHMDHNFPKTKTLLIENINAVLSYVENLTLAGKGDDDQIIGSKFTVKKYKEVSVLVTGSLHLVGCFLSILQEES